MGRRWGGRRCFRWCTSPWAADLFGEFTPGRGGAVGPILKSAYMMKRKSPGRAGLRDDEKRSPRPRTHDPAERNWSRNSGAAFSAGYPDVVEFGLKVLRRHLIYASACGPGIF